MGSSSPNWKQLDDYAFTDSLTREGWCWEFMRRNPEYKKDYSEAKEKPGLIYDPPKLEGESNSEYMQRTIGQELDPTSCAAKVYYALKWGMEPPVQDPNCGDAPKFLLPFPQLTKWDDIGKYFQREESVGPVLQSLQFPTLTFDLTRPLNPQVKQTKKILKELAVDMSGRKQFNVLPEDWRCYLRLLDALNAMAKTKEIITVIEDYKKLDSTKFSGYKAHDAVSDDKKAIKRLMDDPLRILS